MKSVIHLNDIRVYAYHGCLQEESIIGSDYIVNIWVEADLEKSCLSEKLKDTVDYVMIHQIVIEEMNTPQSLLETVAYRILQRIDKLERVHHTTVKVAKINPPIGGDVANISICLSL